MLVYLALDVIPVACMVASVAVKTATRSDIVAFWLMAALLILIGALRGRTVGTDTGGYLLGAYGESRINSLEFFYRYSKYSSWDPLFKLVLWLTGHWSPTMMPVQLACSALTVIPIFMSLAGMAKMNSRFSPWPGVAVYTLLFYPASFNLIRQSIAMSFVVFAYYLSMKRRWFRAFLPLIVAVGFHKSAVVVVPLVLLCALRSLPLRRYDAVRYAVLTVGAIAVLFAAPLLQWATSVLGIYGHYADGTVSAGPGGRRSWLEICFIAVVLVVAHRRLSVPSALPERFSRELSTVCLMGAVLYGLCVVNLFLYRIGLYYLYFFILYAPCLMDVTAMAPVFSKARHFDGAAARRAALLGCLVLLACLVFSIDYYSICKMNEVVPYVFL